MRGRNGGLAGILWIGLPEFEALPVTHVTQSLLTMPLYQWPGGIEASAAIGGTLLCDDSQTSAH